jgi:7-carboxy-7-deazaguanine synthase
MADRELIDLEAALQEREPSGGKPVLVSLSGGNPASQPFAPLIALGRECSHSFVLETQGSIAQPWFAELDWLILGPKPPSAGITVDWVTPVPPQNDQEENATFAS